MKRRNILKALVGIPAAMFVAGKVKADTIISTEGISSGSGLTGLGTTGRITAFSGSSWTPTISGVVDFIPTVELDEQILAPGAFRNSVTMKSRFVDHEPDEMFERVTPSEQ